MRIYIPDKRFKKSVFNDTVPSFVVNMHGTRLLLRPIGKNLKVSLMAQREL